jgi:hypothetical protein
MSIKRIFAILSVLGCASLLVCGILFGLPVTAQRSQAASLLLNEPQTSIQQSASKAVTQTVINRLDGFEVIELFSDEPIAKINSSQSCTITPPSLMAPISGTIVDTIIPNFQWEAITSTAYSEHFQLSRFSSFADYADYTKILHDGNDPRPTYSYDLKSNLKLNTTYYWRVWRECGGVVGDFSPTFIFHTTAITGSYVVSSTLDYPVDNFKAGSIRVNFGFEPVYRATGYQVQFSYLPTMDTWFRLYKWSGSRTTLTVTFDPEKTIYWRVIAKNDFAWGEPSDFRSFTTPPVTATMSLGSSGGTLTPDPGNISLQFPMGVVSKTVNISYQLQPTPIHAFPNFRFAGRAFSLQARLPNGNLLTQFDEPYTMTIEYDSSDLVASGIDNPELLNIAYWDGISWKFILPCDGCSNDTQKHRITVLLDHFTDFALLARTDSHIYLPLILR